MHIYSFTAQQYATNGTFEVSPDCLGQIGHQSDLELLVCRACVGRSMVQSLCLAACVLGQSSASVWLSTEILKCPLDSELCITPDKQVGSLSHQCINMFVNE